MTESGTRSKQLNYLLRDHLYHDIACMLAIKQETEMNTPTNSKMTWCFRGDQNLNCSSIPIDMESIPLVAQPCEVSWEIGEKYMLDH